MPLRVSVGRYFTHPSFFHCINAYLLEGELPYLLVYRIIQTHEGYVHGKAVKELNSLMMTVIHDVEEQTHSLLQQIGATIQLVGLQQYSGAPHETVIVKIMTRRHVSNTHPEPIPRLT